MRGSSHMLAGAMSLLMVSSSVSGSTCELCCGLSEAAGHCHAHRAGEGCIAGYSSKMANDPASQAAEVNALTNGKAAHCASRRRKTAGGGAELAGTCRSGMTQPCGTSMPCGLRGCTRFLSGQSSPSPVVSGFTALAEIAVMSPRQGKLQSGFPDFKVGSSPPEALASDRPSGVLRI